MQYVHKTKNINLYKTFNCGQCFRFNEMTDRSFTGVAFGRVLHIDTADDGIVLKNCDERSFNDTWCDFFAFDMDYEKINNNFPSVGFFKTAAEYSDGIRVLRQDIFETLISFIISQNNNIPRIKKIISSFCENFGEKIIYNGYEYYTFPSPQYLKNITLNDLSVIKSGFRAKYILDAVQKITNGEIDLPKIKSMTYDTAKEELKKIKGVGDKVADCVLLFGAGKYEAFPRDVWIKKVMDTYFGGEDGVNLFGEYAGIAQQYLFYYSRENLNG